MHETRPFPGLALPTVSSSLRSARLALALAVCSSVRLFLRSFVRSGNVRLSTAFAEPDSTNSSVCFVLPCYYSPDPRRVGQRGAPSSCNPRRNAAAAASDPESRRFQDSVLENYLIVHIVSRYILLTIACVV